MIRSLANQQSANLLVTERWAVKIADFGTAKLMRVMAPRAETSSSRSWLKWGRSSDAPAAAAAAAPSANAADAGTSEDGGRQFAEQTTFVGTLLWEAPEILRGDTTYAAPADVYSFGRMRVWVFWSRMGCVWFFVCMFCVGAMTHQLLTT